MRICCHCVRAKLKTCRFVMAQSPIATPRVLCAPQYPGEEWPLKTHLTLWWNFYFPGKLKTNLMEWRQIFAPDQYFGIARQSEFELLTISSTKALTDSRHVFLVKQELWAECIAKISIDGISGRIHWIKRANGVHRANFEAYLVAWLSSLKRSHDSD